jgi:hypothetical protein
MHYLPAVLRPHSRRHVSDIEKDGLSQNTSPYPPGAQLLAHRPTVLPPDSLQKLNAFRHLVGINSTKGLYPKILPGQGDSDTNNLHFYGRAAPNVGIVRSTLISSFLINPLTSSVQYNRCCHREAQAKRGYKFATIFINGCLGLQIIVAAALTAMGAANSSHQGITAFGAINTVIAGILTYLKGSGLPNRIHYYEIQWKKVREYIEQRERDFSRQDCTLDVNEVVTKIEAMYEQVKVDIQTNTPDSYVSVNDARARTMAAHPTLMPDAGRNKIEELELKYGPKVHDLLEGGVHKVEERLRRLEDDIIATTRAKALASLQDGKTAAETQKAQWEANLKDAKVGARDWGQRMEVKGATTMEKELEHASSEVRDFGDQNAKAVEKGVEHVRSGMMQRGMNFLGELEQAKKDVLKQSDDVAKGLDEVRAAALRQGRDYEQNMHAKTASLVEKERDLKREVEHTREATQRAGDSLERAGESVSRVAKAVEDEIQPHKRD